MTARRHRTNGLETGTGSRMFAACGKMGFASRKLAKEQGRVLRTRGRGPFRVYSCEACGFWHLTTLGAASTESIREQECA